MHERELDDLVAVLPPLLQAIERLGFLSRYFHPPQFATLLEACADAEQDLRAERPRLDGWSADFVHVGSALTAAADATLTAYDELRAAVDDPDALAAVFRALRALPRAQEALYPLARGLAPVSRFFLEPAAREDADLVKRLADAPPSPATGVLHASDEPGQRGGFSIYVPEYYEAGTAVPVVFALHGGSGNGRAFLWSWLRDARTRGAILVAPTAVGRTWALQGPDQDSPNLARILEFVKSRWNVDPERVLLSGMSDGGTFAYVSGLETGSPFTHLAPCSAAFHPMLAQFADPGRLAGLPIHITHGALDWMFPVSMARDAEHALARAGANVTYREVADLSHTYPRELNGEVLDWLGSA